MRKIYMFGLVAAAVTALACSSDPGEDNADKAADPGTAQQAGASSKPAPKQAGLGDPVRDGKFEFTVTEMSCGKTKLGGQYVSTKAQGEFCLVTLKVKNIAKEAQLFDAGAQKAFDADGTTYDADSGAAIYANEQAEVFLNNINPGNQVTGTIPFDVPKDTKLVKLELHDSPFSGGATVSVAE